MKKMIIIILILITSLSLFSAINKLNEYITEGFSHSIYLYNETAYIADGSILTILDITTPENIIEIAEYQLPVTSPWIVDVVVENNIAFVVDRSNGLFILDVSNSSEPQLIGQYPCNGLLEAKKYDNIAILKFNYDSTIQLVDISDMTSPNYISSHTFNENYFVSAIETYSNFVYFTCVHYDIPNIISKVFILDFTIPNQPNIINEIEINDRIYYFKIFGSTAYLAGSDYMRFYDLIDPTNPSFVSSFNFSIIFDGILSDYYSDNNYLYLNFWNADTKIFDISDLYNPQLLNFYYNIIENNSDFQLLDNLLYCINEGDGLSILDCSSLVNPELLNWINIPNQSEHFILENNILYFANGLIYDISDITSFILLGQLDYGGDCIAKFGNFIILGRIWNLQVYDVYSPENPELISQLDISNIHSIKIVNNLLYCLNYDNQFDNSYLKIIDISNPIKPIIISSTLIPSMVWDIVIDGDYAYIANQEGIVIINIENSLYPSILSSLITDGHSLSLIKNNSYLFVSDRNSIKIINVNQPENPILSSTIVPHNNSYIRTKPIILNNNLYFVDNNWNEISQYDITEEENPLFINSYKWNLPIIDWTMHNSMFFTSNLFHGFSILDIENMVDIDEFLTPKLFNIYNYPNPFNPITTIEFSIQNDSKIELLIFNVKGQKIKTLANNDFTKGTHSINWNGDDETGNPVSSGIYYYKLNVNGKIESVKKCLLLK